LDFDELRRHDLERLRYSTESRPLRTIVNAGDLFKEVSPERVVLSPN